MQEDFNYQGKVYCFSDVDSENSCFGCAFRYKTEEPSPCILSEEIKDCWEDIIWIEKK